MKLTLTISQQRVIEEVAKTTGYTGAKLLSCDSTAYERISTTDSDTVMLWRFWQESRDNVCTALRRLISAEGMEDTDYRIDLSLSESFDMSLGPRIESGIFSYFVQYITASWLALVNSDKAEAYTIAAVATLADITRNALCKRAPARPNYSKR